jgi:hypothetical protein
VCDTLGHEVEHMNFTEDLEETKEIDKSKWNYEISSNLARNFWWNRKEYFDKFDCIITSDTAPLSRIFLQDDNWKKKLLVWVCNRYDYPRNMDVEYHQLFKKAAEDQKTKFVIPYTEIETVYAAHKGIKIVEKPIKPIGKRSKLKDVFKNHWKSAVPESINKKEVFFLPERHNEFVMNISGQLNNLKINHYSGKYNGPDDLKEFKGIIHFPYAWATLAFYENMQNCMTYVVPSHELYLSIASRRKELGIPNFAIQDIELLEKYGKLVEVYNPENHYFVEQFSSLDELKKLTESDLTRYNSIKQKQAVLHEEIMLERWNSYLSF